MPIFPNPLLIGNISDSVNALSSNNATKAKQDDQTALLTSIDGKTPALTMGSAPVSVQNWPTPGPISGTVDVSNFPVTQNISGSVSITNLPTTQPISGAVSITNLPTNQPISGTVAVSSLPAISGAVTVSNFPATQPVSGNIAITNLPATQPVSGTFWQSVQPVSGTVSVASSVLPTGAASAANQAAANTSLASIDSKLVASQAFTRIKNKQYLDTEEAQYDIPAALASSFIYVGIAAAGSSTSATVWTVVRTSFDANGNPSREQIKTGIAWTNRASAGW